MKKVSDIFILFLALVVFAFSTYEWCSYKVLTFDDLNCSEGKLDYFELITKGRQKSIVGLMIKIQEDPELYRLRYSLPGNKIMEIYNTYKFGDYVQLKSIDFVSLPEILFNYKRKENTVEVLKINKTSLLSLSSSNSWRKKNSLIATYISIVFGIIFLFLTHVFYKNYNKN